MAIFIGALMSLSSTFSLPKRRKPANVLLGFGLTLGFSLLYLTLIVLIPLSATVLKTFTMAWDAFWTTVTASRVVASCKLTFGASLIAAVIDFIFGLIVAWVLVRYRFPDKRLINALVGLPFALPAAAAGIALTALYVPNGWVGSRLEPLGLKIAFTPLGIMMALTFIGLPFVMRTVQPVLEDLETKLEETAASLGAAHWQILIRVILSTLLPASLTGFALTFARTTGECSSVIFIASNMPVASEITPLMICSRLKQFDYTGTTVTVVVMLDISFTLLLMINLLQAQTHRRGNRSGTIGRAPEPSAAHAAAGA